MPTPPPPDSDLGAIISVLAALLTKTNAELQRHSLATAVRMARSGRYAEAEQTVRDAMQTGNDEVRTLDLLARILVRQGRFAEAEGLWQKVVKLAPDDSGATEALHALRALQARRATVWWWRASPALLFIAVASGGMWWACRIAEANNQTRVAQERHALAWQGEWRQARAAWQEQSERAAQAQQLVATEMMRLADRFKAVTNEQAESRTMLSRLETTVAGLAKGDPRIATLERNLTEQKTVAEQATREAEQRHSAAQAQWREDTIQSRRELERLSSLIIHRAKGEAELGPPTLSNLPAWKSTQHGKALVVWSPTGIFLRGLSIVRGKGQDALQQLSRAISRANSSAWRVEVLGAAPEGVVFGDPQKLAYRRAAIVAERLVAASGLTAEHVVARAATRAEVAEQANRSSGQVEAESVIVVITIVDEHRR